MDEFQWTDELVKEFMQTRVSNECYGDIGAFKKLKQQPLFTTTDGVDIFEYQDYWRVNEEYGYFRVSNPSYHRWESEKYFSTENAAKKYILMNKPVLSIQDLKNIVDKNWDKDNFGYAGFFNECSGLAHKKINQ